MPVDRVDIDDRDARVAQMIECYRLAKRRRIMRLAMRMWREIETRQLFAALEAQPERIH
jgi:hypothetical protein